MTSNDLSDRIMARIANLVDDASGLLHVEIIIRDELAPAFEAHRLELDALKRRMAAAANLLTEQPKEEA